MKKSTVTLFLVLHLILSIQFILYTLIFSLTYVLLVFVVANFRMVLNVFSLPYSVFLKTEVLGFSFWGYFHSSNPLNSTIAFLVAVLFGINSAFMFISTRNIALRKKRRITTLVSTFSVLASGCTICGVSLVSTFSAGTLFAFLPLHGYEITITTLFILIVALYFNLKSQLQPCNIT